MKKIIFGTVVSLGLASFAMADGTNLLSDDKTRVSYALGMLTGHSWVQQGVDFDVDVYAKGIKDGASGGATLLTPDQAQAAIAAFRTQLTAKQQQKNAELGAQNKANGEAFLAANKNQPGVQTLPDGLQYIVLTQGSGATPTPADTVTVHYKGTLIDGTEFDSSYKRGQPSQFPVGGVIHGWTEALEKMTVGSKWKLFIPAELAYGANGRPGIPPNAALIFEVELIDTKTPAPPAPAPPLTSDIIKVPSKADMDKGAKIEVIKSEDAAKAATNSGN
jgi:FKBP-type peptidyl-prolyl cis-trans isomerase